MTAAGRSPLRGIAALPLGAGIAGGVAVLASPMVRALATEWVATSRRYFHAVDQVATVQVDRSCRRQLEVEADAAVRDDEAVRRRIIAMRSTEPGALALKVAAFLAHLRGPDEADTVIGDWVAREGPFEEAMALALARDMAAVFGPSVQALADVARPGRRS